MTIHEQVWEELRLLGRALDASTNGIVITDPNQPDNPIIYVNSGFERVTGYAAEEVIGENCRFLQGEDRSQPARTKLDAAIRAGRGCRAMLRNYRKDGTLFYNEIHISPVRDEDGHLTHFIGVQDDVTVRKRAQKQRAVQFGISRLLAKTSDLAEVSQRVLRILGAGLDWDAVELWVLDPDEKALRRTDLWLRPQAWPVGFVQAASEVRPVRGEGLPGRVWISGEPAWLPDVRPVGLSSGGSSPEKVAGLGYPIRVRNKVVGVFGLFSRRVREPDRDSVEAVRAVGNQIAQFIERRRAEEAVLEIREAERRHVALDLHDGVLQNVVGALQGLQAIQVGSAAGVSLEQEIEELRQAMKGLRAAIYDLRQEKRQPFVPAVESLVELNRQHVPERELDLVVQDDFPRKLKEEVENGLLRVLQEALTNVRRHSGARRVEVVLRAEGDHVTLEVIDDGRGFDPWAAVGGIGIPGMKERVAALGGKLRIESSPGKGAAIIASVPRTASRS